MEQETYNGYKNYETWLLYTNLTNEESRYNLIEEWVKINPRENFEFECERAEAFREFLEELFFVDEYNIIKIEDTWTTRDFQEVDFLEVIKGFETI
jgi:enolase